MPSRTRLEFTARTSLASRSGASDRMWPTIRLHTVRTRRSQAAGTITSSSVRLRTVIHAHRKGFTPVAFLHIPFLNLLPWYLADPPSFAHPLTRVALLHSFLPSFTLSRPPSPSARPTHNRQLDPPRVLRVHGHGRVLHREELEPARERGAIQSLRYRAPDGETGPGLVLPKRVLSRCESA